MTNILKNINELHDSILECSETPYKQETITQLKENLYEVLLQLTEQQIKELSEHFEFKKDPTQ